MARGLAANDEGNENETRTAMGSENEKGEGKARKTKRKETKRGAERERNNTRAQHGMRRSTRTEVHDVDVDAREARDVPPPYPRSLDHDRGTRGIPKGAGAYSWPSFPSHPQTTTTPTTRTIDGVPGPCHAPSFTKTALRTRQGQASGHGTHGNEGLHDEMAGSG